MIIDIPRFAFRPSAEIEKILGKPHRAVKSSNLMTWSEGQIVEARYRNGNETMYFRDRLVSITYKFPKAKKPSTIEEALEACGFPSDTISQGQRSLAGFRAFYAPNPSYRNPIRYGGLLFHMVDIPADISHIWVNYANINDRFEDWPEETKTAWRASGAASIPPPKSRIRVGSVPKDGSILDAPFVHER